MLWRGPVARVLFSRSWRRTGRNTIRVKQWQTKPGFARLVRRCIIHEVNLWIDRGDLAKGHRRRRVRNVLLICLSVLVIVVVCAAGYAYYVAHDLKRVDVKGLSKALTSGREEGTENILMVGSTSRCALKLQNPAYGLCQGSTGSAPVTGVNSDVIMILHADPTHHRLALLSIPPRSIHSERRSGWARQGRCRAR